MDLNDDREELIFAEALKKTSRAERAAYLAEACAGDTNLRSRIEGLLAAHEQAGTFLEPAIVEANLGDDEAPVAERPGMVIGRYKLVEQIGEGGMGVVFRAEQCAPLRRQVALKIVKLGMDTKEVIARFETERHALALMEHPNIARVLDAGATETGRPYFAMELVDGISLTNYCDQHRITVRERLELFIAICQAVQHAHQKGIIHRDIKPSNVLVTEQNGKPVPKVIDFGIAKATTHPFTGQTILTRQGRLLGTPEYMSPEQMGGNGTDVDTRSDIYSLGALLYEILAGVPPFDSQRLQSTSLDQMQSIIREEEPPTPSTRLATVGDALVGIASSRQSEPKRLPALLRGDLDWVVMKAIEKDRSRRYETANALAVDVQRHLDNEPVAASPPSRTYRFRKMLRRHKSMFAGTAMVFLALLVGVAGTIWMYLKATAAQRKAAEQASVAQAVNEFVQADLLQLADSREQAVRGQEGKLDLTVREALDRAAARIGGRFKNQPLVEAAIRLTIGDAYLGLKQYPLAVPHLEKSLALRRATLGLNHADTLTSMSVLGRAYLERGTVDVALPLLEQTVKTSRSYLGTQHPTTCESINQLATCYLKADRSAEAVSLLEDALKVRNRKQDLALMNNLASAYQSQHRLKDALPVFEEALKIAKLEGGPDHPDTLTLMNSLALGYQEDGRLAEATQSFEELLPLLTAKLGQEHPWTIQSRANLADAYKVTGRFTEAIELFEQCLNLYMLTRGTNSGRASAAMNDLAAAYITAGRKAEAITLFEQTLKRQLSLYGPTNASTLRTMSNLAATYHKSGRVTEALQLFTETLRLRKATLGPEHSDTLYSMDALGKAYRDAGRFPEAVSLFQDTLKLQEAKNGPEHAEVLKSLTSLAGMYDAQQTYELAEPLYVKVLELRRKNQAPEHPQIADALARLGGNLLKQKKYAEAEPVLRKSLEIRGKKLAGSLDYFDTESLLGASLLGQAQLLLTKDYSAAAEKFTRAEPLLLSGYEGMKARQAQFAAQRKGRLSEAAATLVEVYEVSGKSDHARKVKQELSELTASEKN